MLIVAVSRERKITSSTVSVSERYQLSCCSIHCKIAER